MVTRIKSGGSAFRPSAFGRTMMPESIQRLASYIYVDKALVLKLAKTGLQPENADQIRSLLILNMNPGYDISSPLDGYDAVVMEVATIIVEDNMHLIEDEIKRAQAEALGFDVDEAPPAEVEEKLEEAETETIEERAVREAGGKSDEVLIPEKRRVVHKKTGAVTYRSKSVAWRKRGQKGLSAQEQFVVARTGKSANETQREYIQRFKVYRSKQSILVKQRRLSKKIDLSKQQRSSKPEGSTNDITPK